MAGEEEEEKEVDIHDVMSTDEKKLVFTKVFTVEWNDPDTGVKFVGTFEAKRPSIGMISDVAILKARMCGGERLDSNMDFVNEMRAYLQVVLTKFPDWWKPEDFYDATPLRSVWDHVRGWQDSFRQRAMARRSPMAPPDRAAAAQDGVAPKMVVPQVQQTA